MTSEVASKTSLLRRWARRALIGFARVAALFLPGRLTSVYGVLTDRPEPRWKEMRERYRIYLERLMIEGTTVALP